MNSPLPKRPLVACVGDAFVDTTTYVPVIPRSGEGVWGTPVRLNGGGTAANVASGLAKIGARVVFYGRLGNDENGDFLLKDFISRGVEVQQIVRDPDVASGVVFILVEPNGERTIIPCALGAAYTRLQPADLQPLLDNPPEAVFLTGVLCGDEPSHSSVIDLARRLKNRTRLFFDPNLRHPANSIPAKVSSGMRELAQLCDVILTGESEKIALDIQPQTGQLFVVKCGAEGARLETTAGIQARVKAHAVEVVDATGAGDTFDAAFISAGLRGYPDVDALEIANAAAGLSVRVQGARGMPDWEEILRLWEETTSKKGIRG